MRVLSYTTESCVEHDPARSFVDASKTTCMTRTTIFNGHTFDVAGVVVRDVLPQGDAEANIVVTIRKPQGLDFAKEREDVTLQDSVVDGEEASMKARWTKVEDGKGGKKDGMYEWVCEVQAGQKAELEEEWTVKTLGNLHWEEKAGTK